MNRAKQKHIENLYNRFIEFYYNAGGLMSYLKLTLSQKYLEYFWLQCRMYTYVHRIL